MNSADLDWLNSLRCIHTEDNPNLHLRCIGYRIRDRRPIFVDPDCKIGAFHCCPHTTFKAPILERLEALARKYPDEVWAYPGKGSIAERMCRSTGEDFTSLENAHKFRPKI